VDSTTATEKITQGTQAARARVKVVDTVHPQVLALIDTEIDYYASIPTPAIVAGLTQARTRWGEIPGHMRELFVTLAAVDTACQAITASATAPELVDKFGAVLELVDQAWRVAFNINQTANYTHNDLVGAVGGPMPHLSEPILLGAGDAGDDAYKALYDLRRVPLTEQARASQSNRSRPDSSGAGRRTA
jgi:hypothetical protein